MHTTNRSRHLLMAGIVAIFVFASAVSFVLALRNPAMAAHGRDWAAIALLVGASIWIASAIFGRANKGNLSLLAIGFMMLGIGLSELARSHGGELHDALIIGMGTAYGINIGLLIAWFLGKRTGA